MSPNDGALFGTARRLIPILRDKQLSPVCLTCGHFSCPLVLWPIRFSWGGSCWCCRATVGSAFPQLPVEELHQQVCPMSKLNMHIPNEIVPVCPRQMRMFDEAEGRGKPMANAQLPRGRLEESNSSPTTNSCVSWKTSHLNKTMLRNLRCRVCLETCFLNILCWL